MERKEAADQTLTAVRTFTAPVEIPLTTLQGGQVFILIFDEYSKLFTNE